MTRPLGRDYRTGASNTMPIYRPLGKREFEFSDSECSYARYRNTYLLLRTRNKKCEKRTAVVRNTERYQLHTLQLAKDKGKTSGIL